MDHSTLKQILTAFFSLYFVILAVLYFFGPSSSVSQRELPELTSVGQYIAEEEETPLRFNNPRLAYEIISQLEILPDLADFKPEILPQKPFTNLKTDNNYCEKRRAYFVLYPEAVFEEMAYLSDNPPTSLVREKMLKPLGVDVQPYIGSHMAKDDDTMYDIDPSITNFHSRLVFFGGKKVGRHFSCLSQISNHVPGKIVMGKKFAMTEAAIAYGEQYQNRPQCFQVDKFMPKTYLLYRKDDCEAFFKVLNSPEYEALKNNQTIVFLKKAGEALHMGAGVDPVNDVQEASLRATYDNGKKCGKVNDLFLIQKYIPNPLLIEGRKFDFRFYVMIASTNPLIAYYHDGTLRVSLMKYDANSTDKKTLLTNIALNKDIYDDAKDGKLFNNMSEDELKTAQQWTFSRFEKYLLDSGVISDPSWFDNHLRPQFKKAMIHLLRFGLVAPVATSSVYDLYGLDFMLDTDFNVWFIEANSAPGMGRFSEPVENFVLKMLRDEMEIVLGLLRSRMKRVIKFVNELVDNGSVKETEDGTVKIRGLEMNRMAFEKITENYFEEEFMPSPGNGFAKIIDENNIGAEKYMGFVSAECL